MVNHLTFFYWLEAHTPQIQRLKRIIKAVFKKNGASLLLHMQLQKEWC